jgi:transcriptional regulator with XRE-family HTH domain
VKPAVYLGGVTSTRPSAQARRATERIHRALGEEVRQLREDAGLPRRVLARAAEIDHAFLQRIEDGRARPSLDTYARLAIPLGADLSTHLYPNTGPTVRDRHQARILEWLLGQLHRRWQPFTEVVVRRPARGWIDVVLHDPTAECIVATEIQSALPRLEQLVRWSAEKAASLASWEGYAHLGPVATTSKLLIVRSTRETRATGREFARQLEAAYPAHPQDAVAALTGTRAWPGPALIWVDLRPDGVRFVARR